MTCWCCCCCFALLCSASIPIQRLLCIRSGVCKLLCCCSDFVWCVLFFSLSVSIVFSPSIFLSSYNNGFLVCSIASTYFDRTLESICSAQNNNTQRATFLSKGKPISVPHGALHSCIMITRYQQHNFVQIYSPNVIAIYGMILRRSVSFFWALWVEKKTPKIGIHFWSNSQFKSFANYFCNHVYEHLELIIFTKRFITMRFRWICTHVRQSVRGANEHVYSSFNHYFGLFFQLKYIHELNEIKIL